jgi:hypothetical protein
MLIWPLFNHLNFILHLQHSAKARGVYAAAVFLVMLLLLFFCAGSGLTLPWEWWMACECHALPAEQCRLPVAVMHNVTEAWVG